MASPLDWVNAASPLDWVNAASPILSSAFGAVGGSKDAPEVAESGSNQYVNFDTGQFTVATGGSNADGGMSLPWYVWVIVGVVAIKAFQSGGK